jgi:endonuclease YncB( thermonuclease family)
VRPKAYRLWGIDAVGWPAGVEATVYMRKLVEGHTVVCEPRTKDRYGRTVIHAHQCEPAWEYRARLRGDR